MSENDLLLGIDLGTSRTAVVSSRGLRTLFDSAVAYPKDLIGVKLLGAAHVVGSEALGKSFLEVDYPLKDGVLKQSGDMQQDAARKLIAYAVQEGQPREGDRICAIIGVPANASRFNKSLLLELAQECLDLALVVSEPFLVAYQQERLVNSIVIDIGAGTTDLCGLKGRLPQPEDQSSNTKAGDYIDQLLMSAMQLRYPGLQLTKALCKQIKEQHGFVGPAEGPIEVSLREEGRPVVVDVTEELGYACQAIVPEIIEAIEYLVARFDPSDQETVLQNIILAGGGSRIRGLDRLIAAKLKPFGEVRVSRVEDIAYAGAEGALKLASELPPDYWGQLGESMLGA
ncbi:MAG: rod shape-determining protein [Gammaproteobacteria bacterium SHHR-1]|uniref:MamK family actin-like protein n=1 Tax=Magnetovirga frankeli TaxID=947516 RepID=UPI00029D30F0|nr:magnetosome protein [gamma proteobacterium SS-5]QFY89637.1 rod shape-determining protein [gamma proteobacterium SS-5]